MRPSMERLRELLRYDEKSPSGLIWIQRCGRQGAGSVAGNKTIRGKRVYWEIRIDGYRTYVHRIIWAIDHVVDINNAPINLREATQKQNSGNMRIRSSNTSGFKGVYWHKKQRKWAANIHVDGKTRYLGLFSTKEEAHEAYWRAAQEAFGQFARRA